jgi:hypothetical protein
MKNERNAADKKEIEKEKREIEIEREREKETNPRCAGAIASAGSHLQRNVGVVEVREGSANQEQRKLQSCSARVQCYGNFDRCFVLELREISKESLLDR